MNKNKISTTQFACLISFPIYSFYSGISSYNIVKISGVDSYLSILISYFLGILCSTIFFIIYHYKNNNNIYQKNILLFGKLLGTTINIIINICIFIIGSLLLYHISNFIISQLIDEMPIITFMIILGLIVIYTVSKGINNITRIAIIFFITSTILTLFSYFGILPHFQIKNITPFLEYGPKRVLSAGIELVLINIIPTFLLLIIKKNEIQPNKDLNKKLFFFYTISFLLILIENILTMGALSIYLVKLYQAPEYVVLQKISLFHFIDRIENFIYIKWILTSIVSLSLIVYHIRETFNKANKNFTSSIIMITMIIFSYNFFKTNTFFYTICYYILPYICLILFIIYTIIALNILIKKITYSYQKQKKI